MIDNLLHQALTEFGLDEKEIQVYIGLLALGETTAGIIANKIKMQRELTYIVLRRLEIKGIISTVIKDKKKRFRAIGPALLLEKLEEKKALMKKVLPQLKQLENTSSSFKPKIEVFEGNEGIKVIYNRIFNFYEKNKSSHPLLGYGSAGKFEEVLRWSLQHFIDKRVKLGIHFKGIYNRDALGVLKKNLPLADIRFVNKKLQSSTFYLLYPEHVAIIIFSEEIMVVLLTSKEAYNSHKIYFDLLWQQARA